jgi:membrane protease YdiL (CAAX protease family)
MGFRYSSSNPVEASFVESFFLEKGYSCTLNPTGGTYGMQAFDVFVTGDVPLELEAELKLKLSAEFEGTNQSEIEDEEKLAVAPEKPFSFLGIFFVFLVAQIIYFGSYYWMYRLLGLRHDGLVLLSAVLVPVFLFYSYTKRRVGERAAALLGFTKSSGKSFLKWIAIALIFEEIRIVLRPYLPALIQKPEEIDSLRLAYAIFLVPIFEEICFRGFLQSTLQTIMEPISALAITCILFALFHYEGGILFQIAVFVYGLLYGVCRKNTGSIMAPIAMHIIINCSWWKF